MRVLVIGQGGREHALVKALAESPSVSAVYAMPGNDGMVEAEVIAGSPSDGSAVLEQCKKKDINLVVIGPENFLAEGLADVLRAGGIDVFGPDQNAAQLESSKIFAKEFMEKYKIPSAPYKVVTSVEELNAASKNFTPPYVLKADGLAGGKGVFICKTETELLAAGKDLFENKKLGAAGQRAIIEQFQPGFETSFFVITNGSQFSALPLAQDHKRLLENNEGPNTGGMGTVAPFNLDKKLYQRILDEVVEPTLRGFRKERFVYRGVVFIGLMITDEGPQVLEYNIRFGDPETQVILPLCEGDWGKIFYSVANGQVPKLVWHDIYSACIVLAAENYPASPVKGAAISGDLQGQPQQYFLHAGTKRDGDNWLTNGGRVLNAIGIGGSQQEALDKAYQQVNKVQWSGIQFRKDIGSGWTTSGS